MYIQVKVGNHSQGRLKGSLFICYHNTHTHTYTHLGLAFQSTRFRFQLRESSLSGHIEEFWLNETGLSVDDYIYIYIYILNRESGQSYYSSAWTGSSGYLPPISILRWVFVLLTNGLHISWFFSTGVTKLAFSLFFPKIIFFFFSPGS